MANNLSNFAESGLLEHMFRQGTFAKPTAWLALVSGGLSYETGTGANIDEIQHIAGNGYFRQVVTGNATWSDIAQDANGSGFIYNLVAITFNVNSGTDWGTVSGVCILDNSGDGAGNVLWHGSLTTAKTITVLDQLSFGISGIRVALG